MNDTRPREYLRMELQLSWRGPFSFFDDAVRCSISDTRLPHKYGKGIYLWTIESDGGYYISYAGKTTSRSGFVSRLRSHVRWTLDGKQKEILDPAELANGRIRTYASWQTLDEYRANP